MRKKLRFIIVSFAVSFVVMVALCFYSFERFKTFVEYSNQVDHTNGVIAKLYKIEGHLKDVDRSERGYMLTHDTEYIRLLNKGIDSLYPTLQSIKDLTVDNKDNQNSLIMLKSDLTLRISEVRKNIQYVDSAHSTAISPHYYTGRQVMKDCSKAMRDLHNEESALLKERFVSEEHYQHIAANVLLTLLLVFCVVTLLLFLLMLRELKSRMRYQDELQAKIIDLKRSHNELEQIAYVASHDLQEPLRKIQVFGNRLLFIKKDQLDEDSRETMARINVSAARMQHLIGDLVSLTSLTKDDKKEQRADLNRIVKAVVNEYEEKIEACHATVTVETLPVVLGYPDQLHILVKALLDNALKFKRDGILPKITITNEITKGHELAELNEKLAAKNFNCISISDNGIGFDNKFIVKMFQIFQRLHNEEAGYDGKGIGLAICQRVMANHEGYITANGQTEMGATFKLFFPVEG